MKKWIQICAIALFFAPTASAQTILMSETFNYNTGDLVTQSGGLWAAHSGQGLNPVNVLTDQLTFTGYGLSGTKSVSFLSAGGSTREDVHRSFATATTGSVYASAMVNVATASATTDYVLHMGSSAEGTALGNTFLCRMHLKDEGGVLKLGVSKGSSDTAVYPNTTYAYNETNLVILKYTFVDGTLNDTCSLFVFKPGETIPATEPTPTAVNGASTTADGINIRHIAIRQGSNTNSGKIAGIRISTVWSDLVATASDREELPEGYALSGAYPNPFNPSTTFELTLPVTQQVRVAVYNMLGQEVRLLHNGTLSVGTTPFKLNAAGLPSGLYFYRVQGANFVQTKAATLLK
ncbi:MAG: T9SS type A sorting domain-containing protein [Bacteroidetes Order II. Incertae sedis bacterium]|nr:T9SS type A sorting domain-containing protein [Bacteroidetes Order II. bacterium]